MTIERIPMGDRVVCDDCGEEYTLRDDVGGILFASKAMCPECVPEVLSLAKKYNEEHLIRGRCPDGMSFAAWVRSLRGGPAEIKIYTGKDALKALGWGEK